MSHAPAKYGPYIYKMYTKKLRLASSIGTQKLDMEFQLIGLLSPMAKNPNPVYLAARREIQTLLNLDSNGGEREGI